MESAKPKCIVNEFAKDKDPGGYNLRPEYGYNSENGGFVTFGLTTITKGNLEEGKVKYLISFPFLRNQSSVDAYINAIDILIEECNNVVSSEYKPNAILFQSPNKEELKQWFLS